MTLRHQFKKTGMALLVCSLVTANLLAKTLQWPEVSIEKAIAVAREQVKKEKVDVSQHFIGQVQYLNRYDAYQTPLWRIEWRLKNGVGIKGGQIIVTVDQKGNATLGRGE